MLQAGKNIKQPGDKLFKIETEYLFEKINKPDAELKSKIDALRTLETISKEKYREKKTELPYFTCGIFNPPVRKTENFASIAFFIIDIDHLSENNENLMQLKMRLVEDDRIYMLFNSPSNNGIKIMFRLAEKCYDRIKYKLFYKVFTSRFAEQYNLQKVTDTGTNDVTRACFISYDKDAFLNTNAKNVDIKEFIDFENPEQVRTAEKLLQKPEKKKDNISIKPASEPSLDVLDMIKQKLSPITRNKKITVPEKLNEIIPILEEKIKEHDIKIVKIIDIQYGKQIRFETGIHFAEINIFFGQRGFSVVKSTKQVCSEKLNDIVFTIAQQIVMC